MIDSELFMKSTFDWIQMKIKKLYLNSGTPTEKKFTDINSYGYLRISKEIVEPEIILL